MRALNLYTLTRISDSEAFSNLENALSGRSWHKIFSRHEAASLCSLVDGLASCFIAAGKNENEGESGPAPSDDWVSFFDGFYFSYTIEHISKEFDLLKFSADADCALNIELKSEAVDEDRIRKQLEQNRYYLSHVARTILSYTYVMEEDSLYCLNDHGFLRKCPMSELAKALQRPALQSFVEEKIGRFFRAQDYLISPIRNPEKLLTGRYFLTNQQSEFRRQILTVLDPSEEKAHTPNAPDKTLTQEKKMPDQTEDLQDKEQEAEQIAASGPAMISLTGNAGTGKTLLLFDLAFEISKKREVLFLHGGPLRDGHHVLNKRLHKVTVLSGTEPVPGETGKGKEFEKYACILVDEANRIDSDRLEALIIKAIEYKIPCIFSYDPHSILGPIPLMESAEAIIVRYETMRLELSGNIRINRPIFSFLRTLFHQKDISGYVDYSCIDVLYAADKIEERRLTAHYLAKGYELIRATPESFQSGDIISLEFERVLMILDDRFYYDESMHLCADSDKGAAIPPLYEGLSRARERLCLLVSGNETLFRQILAIRTHLYTETDNHYEDRTNAEPEDK